MKNLKYFFGAFLMGAVLLSACKDDDDPKPTPNPNPNPTEEVPEVAAVAGKVVLVLNCVNEAEVCNGLVFAGDYNDWGLEASEMATFEPINDYDGWYKVEITPTATPEDPSVALKGKPNQLAADGTFPSSWDYQWFAQMDGETVLNECEVIKGDASLYDEYNGEKGLSVAAGADVVYIRTYAWKKNPCIPAETYTVTFNVTVPEIAEEDKVYIVGGMNGWTVDASEMTKSGETWSITIDGVELNTEYKYVLNANWDNEELKAIEEGKACADAITNRKVNDLVMTDVVENFKGITASRCEAITFTVTVPAGLSETDVVYIAGGMNDWTSDVNALTKNEDGTWTITFEDFIEPGTEYKYILNGSWDNEELAAIAEGAECADGIDNRKLGGTDQKDTVENFKGVTADRCP